jgi:hypothetical protein
MPKMKVRPMTTRAMRRKSRRFVSDIFDLLYSGSFPKWMPKSTPKDFDRSLICALADRDYFLRLKEERYITRLCHTTALISHDPMSAIISYLQHRQSRADHFAGCQRRPLLLAER